MFGSALVGHAGVVDLDLLTTTIERWERDGTLVRGEAIVVGRHEPAPVEGARRVGAVDAEGRALVEVLDPSGTWVVQRRYVAMEPAVDHVFDRLGSVVAERHWGPQEWARIRAHVRQGALLRIAALLVRPDWDLGGDRWDLVERLRSLGLEPEGRYWVEGVDGLPPPGELVPQLRREDGWWVVGGEERGVFRVSARYSDEGDACRRLFREVFASGAAVSMGVGGAAPHVVARFTDEVRAALEEALALVSPTESS